MLSVDAIFLKVKMAKDVKNAAANAYIPNSLNNSDPGLKAKKIPAKQHIKANKCCLEIFSLKNITPRQAVITGPIKYID